MLILLILHVDTRIMILSCSYLGHSGETVLISNMEFETKSGIKWQGAIYKENLIRYNLKGIPHWES